MSSSSSSPSAHFAVVGRMEEGRILAERKRGWLVVRARATKEAEAANSSVG